MCALLLFVETFLHSACTACCATYVCLHTLLLWSLVGGCALPGLQGLAGPRLTNLLLRSVEIRRVRLN